MGILYNSICILMIIIFLVFCLPRKVLLDAWILFVNAIFQVSHIQGSIGFEQLIEPLKYHRGVVTVSDPLVLDILMQQMLMISWYEFYHFTGSCASYLLHQENVCLHSHISMIMKFGSSGMLIQDTLSSHGLSIPCLRAKDLKGAVRLANNMAKPGMSFFH